MVYEDEINYNIVKQKVEPLMATIKLGGLPNGIVIHRERVCGPHGPYIVYALVGGEQIYLSLLLRICEQDS